MSKLSRDILEQIIAHSSEGVAVAAATAPKYPVVYVNSAYQSMRDCRAEEILSRRFPLLDDDAMDESQAAGLAAALSDGDSFEAQLSFPGDAPTNATRNVRVEPLFGRRGRVTHIMLTESRVPESDSGTSSLEVGVLQREILRARQKVASMDRIDPATGLLRYEHFLEIAGRDFRIARREGRSVAVLALNIPELDVYGQTFGVKAAQSCLRMVAAQVNCALRRVGDICARADDDRIVVVTQGQDVDEVSALGLRIAANVRRLGIHNPRARSGRYVSAQIGFSSGLPDGKYTPKEAIAAAFEDLCSQESGQNPLVEAKA